MHHWFLIAATLIITTRAASAVQVIVDNDDGPPAYVETGSWTTSAATGYNGGTYRFANVGAPGATAVWTAEIPSAGDYEVFVWYVPGGNRASSTRYEIHAADGVHTVFRSQQAGGLTWESLGTFSFSAGQHGVVLDAAGSSGGVVVIADAVRFGQGGGGPPVDPPTPVEVAPGVFHSVWELPTPLVIHVLEFDLADPRYTVDLGFAQGQRYYTAKEPLTQLVTHYEKPGRHVVAAINASFFEAGLGLLGMLGANENLISSRDNTPGVSQHYMLQASGLPVGLSNIPTADMVARFDSGAEVPINILDFTCSPGMVSLYTPDWGPRTQSTNVGVEIIVDGVNGPLRPNKWFSGTITAVRTGPPSLNNFIPPDGFVLAACPGAESLLLPHAVVGQQVAVRHAMTPPLTSNMRTLVTGNVWIVKDGAPFHPGETVRHPRTVIAWSGTRHWFVTFDGRQPGYSVGASTPEQADFLINALGVENAINLDGGGSTTMVIQGQLANCPSDNVGAPCTGTQRANPNALMLIDRNPRTKLPISDAFPPSGRALSWDDKFTMNPVTAFSPPAPGGDGHVMHLFNHEGGFETASVGSPGDADYTVAAQAYCRYRPEVAADGFERVGVFARDNGNGLFESAALGGGNCYALTYDSHDGRIRAGVVVNGVFSDFLDSAPLYAPATAWRKLAIRCDGDEISYRVDDVEIAAVIDDSHVHGRAGVGYHSYFTNHANALGAPIDDFTMFGLAFDWDDDGDVDWADAQVFFFCMQGPDADYPPSHFCLPMDGDGDLDVDLADAYLLQAVFTGPG